MLNEERFKEQLAKGNVEAIVTELDGADYGSGAMEVAQETATKTSRALAELLVMLKDKAILTNDDIFAIVEKAQYAQPDKTNETW
jgi:hypothetical protein